MTNAYPFAIVVCFEDEKRERFVLARHADRGWEIPGGNIEDDETPREAALREFREEIGRDLEELSPVLVQDREGRACHVFEALLGEPVETGGDDPAIHGWRLVEALEDVEPLAFPEDPYLAIELELGVELRSRKGPFVARDVDEILVLIESRWQRFVEGCEGWIAWLAEGGGRLGLRNYLLGAPEFGPVDVWETIAPVPRAEERYRPQGLAYVDGELWLTDHQENRRSHLYKLDPATGEVRLDLRMPDEARHPGGLAEDGEHLWALDYVSAKLYRIDLDATIEREMVVADREQPTGLHAASALDIVEADGRRFMAFSDFLWRNYTLPPVPDGTGHTFLVPFEELSSLGQRSVPEAATLAYDNGGYPQGLAYLDGHLLEAVNHHGRDWIWALDVDEAVRERDPQLVERVGAIAGPDDMIEDLATDGDRLWTTDESTYELYVLDDTEPVPQTDG